MQELKSMIDQAYEQRQTLDLHNDKEIVQTIHTIIDYLNQGKVRAAEPTEKGWQVNDWVKKAILLYFKISKNQTFNTEFTHWFDKIPLKFQDTTEQEFTAMAIRAVPMAVARHGAYIGKNVILMPSFVNMGAYIDDGCMIDTWATVGSCAQIGKNVHISGGAGIGGVLEPLQATPTIIEDDCFIGARSEIAEGVIVKRGAVISMGVFLSQSTKIYHRATGEITYGCIPAGSVVVPGNLPSKDGSHSVAAAIIVKQVDAGTLNKVELNQLLRDVE